jgi:hypothetical protein
MSKRAGWIILIFVVLAVVQLTYIVFALMELHSSKPAFAQDDESNRQTLHGLRGVHVVIEFPKPEIKGDGLTEGQLRNDAELKLQEAGIKVLSERENQMTPGRPTIYLNMNILKYRYFPVYVYKNSVELVQDVYLVRTFRVRTGAVTWSVSANGIAPKLEDVRTSMEDLVDYFINAYLSANSKGRSSSGA